MVTCKVRLWGKGLVGSSKVDFWGNVVGKGLGGFSKAVTEAVTCWVMLWGKVSIGSSMGVTD